MPSCGQPTRSAPRRLRWAAVVATTPFLYNSFAIYPEIPAALAAVIGAEPDVWAARARANRSRVWSSSASHAPHCHGSARSTRRCLPPSSSSRWRGCGGQSSLRSDSPPAEHCQNRVGHRRRRGPALTHVCAGHRRRARAVCRVAGRVVLFLLRDLGRAAARRRPMARWCRRAPSISFSAGPGCSSIRSMACCRMRRCTSWPRPACGRCGGTAATTRRRAIEVAIVSLPCSGRLARFAFGGAAPRRLDARSRPGCCCWRCPSPWRFAAQQPGSARRAAQHLLLWVSIGIAILSLVAETDSSSPTAATGRRACSSISRRGGRRGPSRLRLSITKPPTALPAHAGVARRWPRSPHSFSLDPRTLRAGTRVARVAIATCF